MPQRPSGRTGPKGSPTASDKDRIDELSRALREKIARDPDRFARLLTEWLKRPAPSSKKSETPPYHRRKLG